MVVTDTYVWWETYGNQTNDLGEVPVKWYGAFARSTWQATDARLSGEVTYREMMHRYLDHGFDLMTAEYTVVNDDGSWIGTGYGVNSESDEYGRLVTVVLHGAGAYDGLTAFLNANHAVERDVLRGVVVADGMPPLPNGKVIDHPRPWRACGCLDEILSRWTGAVDDGDSRSMTSRGRPALVIAGGFVSRSCRHE